MMTGGRIRVQSSVSRANVAAISFPGNEQAAIPTIFTFLSIMGAYGRLHERRTSVSSEDKRTIVWQVTLPSL